jgi:regulator of replication initiation timing
MKVDIMATQIHTVSGKKDYIRDVVIKYIDHFYPDASGTSAVAIDNKIEQAMDLVKSHLMFAVREEVEVLKEKIAELMDRINQLEVENTILKANASQETLSQLSATAAAVVVPSPQPLPATVTPIQQQLQNNSSPALNTTNEQATPVVTPNQQTTQQQQPPTATTQQTNNINPPSQQNPAATS